MTMANATSAAAHRPSPSASLRKTNKPLMEKRRRARINDSLGQLKSLVIQSSKKDSSQFNKLEKADILEMTVKHLRTLHTQQQSQQQQLSQVTDPTSTTKYHAGFMECANEVMRFLKQSQGFSDEIKSRVVSHLASCLHQTSSYPRPSPVSQNTSTPRLNSGPPATTAQLPNGQIIQIVSNTPFHQQSQISGQQAPPSAVLVATSIPTMSQPPQQTAATPKMTPPAPSAQPQRTLAPEPVHQESSQSYSRYCQPLHIQIPNTESPVLVKQIPQPQLPVVKSEERVPPVYPSREVSPQSYTSMSPSPIQKDISPVSRSAAYKHLDFYAPENYSDYDPRSRTYSSTSSSESESPLNLSQSPPYSSLDSRMEYSHESVQQAPSMDYQPTAHTDKPSVRESFTTSVIVNHKKALDIPSAKYLRMMEEERLCNRSQGTPSPASSMGEAAVWRPW